LVVNNRWFRAGHDHDSQSYGQKVALVGTYHVRF
jgi:hypothetical protein